MELKFEINLTDEERKAIELVGDLINELDDENENVCNLLDIYENDLLDLAKLYENFEIAIEEYEATRATCNKN